MWTRREWFGRLASIFAGALGANSLETGQLKPVQPPIPPHWVETYKVPRTGEWGFQYMTHPGKHGVLTIIRHPLLEAGRGIEPPFLAHEASVVPLDYPASVEE